MIRSNKFSKCCIMILYALCLILPSVGFTGQTSEWEVDQNHTSSSNSDDYNDWQFSFGYWNDNFISKRKFEPFLNVGKDDNVTTSFYLRTSLKDKSKWWLFNIYYHILTDKYREYRTDLMTIFPSVEYWRRGWILSLGCGIALRGNYGGKAFQEGYHELRDFAHYELNYTNDSSTSLFLSTGLEYMLLGNKASSLGMYQSNSIGGNAGPNNS